MKKTVFFLVILSLLLPAVQLLGVGQAEGDLTTVTFRMNWKFSGPHAVYLLGKDLGFYEDEGIDLQVMEGNGSVTTAQLIGNKSDDFGLADAGALVPIMAKGLPIKSVAMITPFTALAVVASKASGIRSMKDLEGKKLVVTAGDSLTQIWPAVVAANKLDASKIDLIYVDAAAKIPTVLAGKADALLGSAGDQSAIMEDQGFEVVDLKFADYGVNLLNLGIFVHEDMIKDNPDLIRRFLRATKKSHEALDANYDKAMQLLVGIKKELKVEVAKKQGNAYYSRMESPNCKSAAILYNCPGDWAMTVDLMKKYRDLEGEINAADFFTNDFLP
ncbi:MAG: ABC transporter substrate-binding protein [Spirochaetia bacterium]